LEKGVDINGRVGGGTALHHAARLGQDAVVPLHLEMGADSRSEDGDGLTAQHAAASGGL
jgi:ankyrin repeat protein